MTHTDFPTSPHDECNPEELRMLQVINGLSDGVILLGSGRRITWANDAALRMHGVKRLQDLGETIGQYREHFELYYRNNHPVEPERYPLERLVRHEEFDDVVVEVRVTGGRDDGDDDNRRVHAVRGIVFAGDADTRSRCALIISDETERFEAERRFESAFRANPAPAIICCLSDMRYIRVNSGFIEMTGYARADILGAAFDRIDVLTDADHRDLALERLKERRAIPQMESSVPVPGGRLKSVIVAGEPIEVEGEACALFTFVDMDARKQSEAALRQSEERFAKSFRLSPAPAFICRADRLELVEVNEAFQTLTGWRDEEVVGHDISDLKLWADPAAKGVFISAVSRPDGARNLDIRITTRHGDALSCLLSADRIAIGDESHVLGVMQDITDRKRTEEELIAAIEAVMSDTSWFSRSIIERLALLRGPARPHRIEGSLGDLTNREREILGLLCEGLSNAEMSKLLNLSPNTVRNHVSSLYQKIGVTRRAAAIIWGRERGVTGRSTPRRP